MSNNKRNVDIKNTDKKEEKIVTKYDLKMQRRKEQKEREKKQERIGTIVGVLIVIALVCLVASFPLRTYLATHETYVEINGEKITRVEYDYNFALVEANYLEQNGFLMAYMGIDLSGDLSKQMYSDTLTWKDFFDQLAVENIAQNKGILAEARAAGFTYDAAEDYAEYEQVIKDAASEAGVSVREYVSQIYGDYATMGRISKYIKEAALVNAYYEQVMEGKTPADEEIEAYYQENSFNYDKVDYRLLSFDAELPTEPTELADTSTEPGADGAVSADGATDTVYEPSEAEIAKAMTDARKLAEAAESTVAAAGTLNEGVLRTSMASAIRDWVFDDARKAGDTTVIEDSNNYRYYVVAFEKRYLDLTPSVDMRVLITDTEDGQALLDTWASGEATEESFAELCREHSADSSAADGGLYEGLTDGGMDEALSSWIFDSARQAGDTAAITPEDGYTYVFYYIGTNDPEYKLDIKSTLLTGIMEEYLAGFTENIDVKDPKKRLAYLYVEETPSEEEAEATENTENTETAQ